MPYFYVRLLPYKVLLTKVVILAMLGFCFHIRRNQYRKYWSVKISKEYRAVGIEVEKGISWFWIGTHAEYDRLIGK